MIKMRSSSSLALISEAPLFMGVDDSDGLKIGVDDRGSDKAHASLMKIV